MNDELRRRDYLVGRCERAASEFEHLIEFYGGDLRTEGAANAAALVLVRNGGLFRYVAKELRSRAHPLEGE